MFKITLAIFCACAVGMMGCSAGNETTQSEQVRKSEADLSSSNPNYRASMDHFISGNINDVKGEYAQAILDYQEALSYYKDPSIYDAMAKDYLRLGKTRQAVEESKVAVSLDPSAVGFRQTLAQAYLGAFQLDSATMQYEKIVSLDSTSVEDILVLAQLYQNDHPNKAAVLYEKALQMMGPNLPTMMQLVKIYNSTNQFDKSIAVINEMLKIDPSNDALNEMLADLYMQVGKNEEALRILKKLMDENKDDYTLKARAATAYLRMKDFEDADSLLDTVFTSDSTKVDAKFAIAQFYLNEMQQDSTVAPFAERIFAKLLQMYPDDPRAYFMAGLGASYVKKDSIAAEYLRKSISIDSTNVNAWQALGVLYYQRKDYVKMAAVMSEAVKHFPEDYRTNLFLGLALNQEGKNLEAVRPLEKALSLKPTDQDVLSVLGQVYEALHRYDDAYRLYDTALKIDPKNSLILNNYAYSLSERDVQLDKALQMAKLAIELDPKNSAYLDTMGWVYYKLGEYEKAADFVKKALAARSANDGSSSTLEEHLGDIYEKLGDTPKAVEHWKKALEGNPKNEALKEKIEKAKT
ncbi:MAG: tetratricopeptide repeat protein [Bacteroidetes bacterium]|nr:tetratricopeptide repeat protein [Bacteroidota bacterium]